MERESMIMIENEPSFSEKVKTIIRMIPPGKVSTYGEIAAYAGDPRGARQVSWVLHSSSQKDRLPWHRVINSKGQISLRGSGHEMQKALLEKEGIRFDEKDTIDLGIYLWQPEHTF